MEVKVLSSSFLTKLFEPAQAIARPRVDVIPYVAEQGHNGSHGPVSLPTQRVIDLSSRALQSRATITKSLPVAHLPDSHFWASSLAEFMERVAPSLPKRAIIVSHGNFMRREVCGLTTCPQAIPNGGVVQVQRGSQKLFFVRHCATCHNIDKVGSSGLTVCHNFADLEPASRLVRRLIQKTGCPVYCSPLPRAVLSALALQTTITEEERRAFCSLFGACTGHITRDALLTYNAKWSCGRKRLGDESPFCAAA